MKKPASFSSRSAPRSQNKGGKVRNGKESNDSQAAGPGEILDQSIQPLQDLRPSARLSGGQLVRAAGTAAQLLSKENGKAMIRLPSGEVRTIPMNCNATIGQIGNIEHDTVKIGKAGKKRHMGIRPTVRGSAMNPCDHPHGGGEGKSPVGHPGPLTPWGKPALGYKTRKHKARTEKFIVKHRSAK